MPDESRSTLEPTRGPLPRAGINTGTLLVLLCLVAGLPGAAIGQGQGVVMALDTALRECAGAVLATQSRSAPIRDATVHTRQVRQNGIVPGLLGLGAVAAPMAPAGLGLGDDDLALVVRPVGCALTGASRLPVRAALLSLPPPHA